MDMNNNALSIPGVLSAQYLVYSAIEDWHPESGYYVYGSIAPSVTNLDSRSNKSPGIISAKATSKNPPCATKQ